MKTTGISPELKFKNLLNGLEAAKYSSFILIILSTILIYNMRGNAAYIVPLIIGVLLIIWYTATYLRFKTINPGQNDLESQVKLLRKQVIQRDKYEVTVFFIWSLTVIPPYLNGKEINMLILICYMIITYLFAIFGNNMFKKAKKEIRELELHLNNKNNLNKTS